jgi:glycosyltransferase involved in cell wall biosynthesis
MVDVEDIQTSLSVLLIAYHFPPIGGAGVQRSLKFARYLPGSRCRVKVITGPGDATGRWTPIDETLIDEIPEEAEVVRLQAEPLEASEPPLLRQRLRRWLRVRSRWSRWWIRGVQKAAGDMRDVDVIVASASPYDSIEAAARVARRLGKPWIADLRDPWALDEMMVYASVVHRRLEIRRMRRLLRSAAAIVMSTPEAAAQVRAAFPELCDRPVVAIPNGYDPADFAAARELERDRDTFRIVHTGYMHAEAGYQQRRRSVLHRLVGGANRGVDILPRSHVFLLEAVDRLLERDPSLRNRLEIHFAGSLTDTGKRLARRSPVTVLHGYLPHADSIALIKSADLLFLPMQKVGDGRRSSTVPGKTYEYLASGRPILGAVPAGDARDLLTAVGHPVCCPDDVTAICELISAELERKDAAAGPRAFDAAAIHRFERQQLAFELGTLVRDVASPQPAGRAARLSIRMVGVLLSRWT